MSHSDNFGKKLSYNSFRFSSGDVAEFGYKDKDGNLSSRKVLVLGVDDKDGLLHALDLSEMSPRQLQEVAESMAEIGNYMLDFESQFLSDETLLFDVDRNDVERWYDRRFGGISFDGDPYRTFKTDRIRRSQLVTEYQAP